MPALERLQHVPVEYVQQAAIEADSERNERRARLAEIDKLYTEEETELRARRTEIKPLAEQLGSGDTAASAMKQQIALQDYAEARRELPRVHRDLQRAQNDLQIKLRRLQHLRFGRVKMHFTPPNRSHHHAYRRLCRNHRQPIE
jgi:hypothetical protein